MYSARVKKKTKSHNIKKPFLKHTQSMDWFTENSFNFKHSKKLWKTYIWNPENIKKRVVVKGAWFCVSPPSPLTPPMLKLPKGTILSSLEVNQLWSTAWVLLLFLLKIFLPTPICKPKLFLQTVAGIFFFQVQSWDENSRY